MRSPPFKTLVPITPRIAGLSYQSLVPPDTNPLPPVPRQVESMRVQMLNLPDDDWRITVNQGEVDEVVLSDPQAILAPQRDMTFMNEALIAGAIINIDLYDGEIYVYRYFLWRVTINWVGGSTTVITGGQDTMGDSTDVPKYYPNGFLTIPTIYD